LNTQRRAGFTLIELIVVTVLGSLVVASALQILIINQRTYTAQSARIQGQQANRAALDILTNELREISGAGGDIVTMTSDSVGIRSMRKFGLTCSVKESVDQAKDLELDQAKDRELDQAKDRELDQAKDRELDQAKDRELDVTSPPLLTVIKVGDWYEVGDSVLIFADNVTDIASDDVWISGRVTAVDTTKTCASADAQELTFGSQSSVFAADAVRNGAPVRGYTYYTYGTFTFMGETYLGRADTTGTMVPVVGPLKAINGLQFAYLDSLAAVTNTAANVRLIQVTLRSGGSGVLNSVGNEVSDSVTATIYMRN
jgi:prepilin-type N-terminal cleavage/methylation domain-containing protein